MSETPLVPPPPPPQSRSSDGVFIGPHGLRAGWRVVIFVAMMVVLGLSLGAVLRHTLLQGVKFEFSPTVIMAQDVLSFAIVFIATAIAGRFERRSFADYGLPARGFLGKHFWIGAVWGFVMLSLIVALMAATHAYTVAGFAVTPSQVVKYGLLWAVAFLFVGFFEEFTFRGYIQYTLTNGLGFWPAAAITCTVFALAHSFNPGEDWVGVVEIILIAFFLCTALRRTGNLWFAIGWHMAFDWGESFFYSTPNSGFQATGHLLKASLVGSKWLSGGSVGPEASIFDLIVTALGIVLLVKLYPEAKYGVHARPAISEAVPGDVAPGA